MLNSTVLAYLRDLVSDHKASACSMGDHAQLPPVGERESPIWTIENKSSLTKVMRHDNQILNLATAIRKLVDHPAPNLTGLIKTDKDEHGGVEVINSALMTSRIWAAAHSGN